MFLNTIYILAAIYLLVLSWVISITGGNFFTRLFLFLLVKVTPAFLAICIAVHIALTSGWLT